MGEIEVGARFFWSPSIFPYYIREENSEYIVYKRYTHGWTNREEFAEKKVYRYVFEEAIKNGEIEFK